MSPDEASEQLGAEQTSASTSVAPRPSGRSRYSRGRRRPRRSGNRPRRLPASQATPAGEAGAEPNASAREAEVREPLPPPFQPAKVESIHAAIEKVTTIIGELRDVLQEMELVLEYLEEAERQQIADEREIEMLQQRLNTIQRRADRQQPQTPSRPPQSRRVGEDSGEVPTSRD